MFGFINLKNVLHIGRVGGGESLVLMTFSQFSATSKST